MVSQALVVLHIFACVAARRLSKHRLHNHVKNLLSIRRHQNFTSSFSGCSLEDPVFPANLLAVDGGGTRVKVLLLPRDWPQNRKVTMIAQLNQCETTEDLLKKMLTEKQLWIPNNDKGLFFLPVTGSLGSRMKEEARFKSIVAPIGEFEAIVEGTVSEKRKLGFESCIPNGAATIPTRDGDPGKGISQAIFVDTSFGWIYRVAWNAQGTLIKATQLSHLGIDNSLFNKNLNQLLKRFKSLPLATGTRAAIYKEAADRDKTRLILNGVEARLRDVRQAIESSETDGRQLKLVDAALDDIYKAFTQDNLVSKAHELIKEIYPTGIGKLGPFASACFMAHADSCQPDFEGAVHFVMGFLEMMVVNTIDLADLWKEQLHLDKVVYVGSLVQDDHTYGKISRQFFTSRMSGQMDAGTVLLDTRTKFFETNSSQDFKNQLTGLPQVHPIESPYSVDADFQIGDSFVIASLGTGVPIMKVEQGKYKGQVRRSAVGGGTFWGLMQAAYPGEYDFEEVVEAAITEPAKDNDRLIYAQRVITSIAQNTAEIAALSTLSILAEETELDTIVFVGDFLKRNPLAQKVIAHVCARYGVKAVFEIEGVFTIEEEVGTPPVELKRLRGFVGAFGAWLLRRQGDATPAFKPVP